MAVSGGAFAGAGGDWAEDGCGYEPGGGGDACGDLVDGGFCWRLRMMRACQETDVLWCG